MDCMKEVEGKRTHDRFEHKKMSKSSPKRVWVNGPVIVGAGPSGLAAAACLKDKNVQSLILERANCIASLWQLKTYDRLRLHLPKQFCELPFMPFPSHFPTYPSKEQFISYLEDYASRFGLEPEFNRTVVRAELDEEFGYWMVKCVGEKAEEEATEYVSRWLIVATGENAEEVMPEFEGMMDFSGRVIHTSQYKSGKEFQEKKVLVVGCGNSGMEVCLDLCNYSARPFLVVRDSVHVLPQEMIGRSTFGLSMWLLKWFPVRLADRILLFISNFVIGNTENVGLSRPRIGPLELKGTTGKTPVLDVGTLDKIRTGQIKVVPAIKRLTKHAVEFIDGTVENFDAIILATGYRSNVPSWLKGKEFFSEKDGFPIDEAFLNGWKAKDGLYAIGFTKRGLLGTSLYARKIAEDIEHQLKVKALNTSSTL